MWQAAGSFTQVVDNQANLQYKVRVLAENGAGSPILTQPALKVSIYTLGQVALAPVLSNPTTYSINVTIPYDGNPSTTTYALWVSTTNWLTTVYVQLDKSLGASIVWQSSASWTQLISTSANVQYKVSIQTKNGSGVTSSTGPVSSLYTMAQIASAPTLSAATTYSINIILPTDSNPAGTQYAIWVSTDNWAATKYVQLDQSMGNSLVWQSGASWTQIISTDANVQYRVKVQSRNGDSVVSTTGTETSLWGLATVPVAPTLSTATTYSFNINIPADGNPTGTQYAVQVSTSNWSTFQYLQVNKSLSAGIVWQAAGSFTQVVDNQANLQYKVRVLAENGALVLTSTGPESSIYTLGQVALAPILSNPTTYSINVTIPYDGNPSTTTYALWVSTTNWVTTVYVQLDKSLGARSCGRAVRAGRS